MTSNTRDSDATLYRKKPIVIQAVQFTGNGNFAGHGAPDWLWEGFESGTLKPHPDYVRLKIQTLEGEMVADPDDWIIRGVKGELYPCKPDIFAATYEPAGKTRDSDAMRDALLAAQDWLGEGNSPLALREKIASALARDEASAERPDPTDIQGWSVTVNVNAQDILTIGHNSLSGIDNIEDFAPVVRNCAEHLLSFIGKKDASEELKDWCLREWESVINEPIGTLTVHRYRGIDSMVNHDFEYFGSLPDGGYSVYASPSNGTRAILAAREAGDGVRLTDAQILLLASRTLDADTAPPVSEVVKLARAIFRATKRCDGSGAVSISVDDWTECAVCNGAGCSPIPHKWDKDGERCEKCGDKDWMADTSCSERLLREAGSR
ncbi:hypothetical protein [Paraburkholderia phenoliruptrix]|uniref:hypothetical protein n=1 Tax=Paraburkholderia phenoliruptrix TaxID=252970 RepID=UPI0028656D43|nr:hypothetical protein [Paraburkholderia phenoliruptrix]MDR6393479.1 hypothetical protein [Paraburkholderia phenoliruptrix]